MPFSYDDAKETHPLFAERLPQWKMLRDSLEGEWRIKSKTVDYLPPTNSMIEDGMWTRMTTDPVNATLNDSKGYRRYKSYLARSVYPDLFEDTVNGLTGVIHRKPFTFKVPKRMEEFLQRVSSKNESIYDFARRMTSEVLSHGRFMVLVDPKKGDVTAGLQLIGYTAEEVRNWDTDENEKLTLITLDECTVEREPGTLRWKKKDAIRVLELTETNTYLSSLSVDGAEPQMQQTPEGEKPVVTDGLPVNPMLGGKTLDFIPAVFVGPRDLVIDPDRPPLASLANLCLTIYRGEADYRQHLFETGQSTLVVTGEGVDAGAAENVSPQSVKQRRLGAGNEIALPLGGDAKFIAADGASLSAQQSSVENDYVRAQEKGAQLLKSGGGAESGDALHVRVAARTASLTSIANAVAGALKESLKIVARWMGLPESEIDVVPNTDFTMEKPDATFFSTLQDFKAKGGKISDESVHRLLKAAELTEMDFEDEMDLIAEEVEAALANAANNPLLSPDGEDNPEDDPEDDPAKKKEAEKKVG